MRLGQKMTDEQKLKISQANKGKKRSEEARKRIGEKSRGRKHTQATKDYLSKISKGKKPKNIDLFLSLPKTKEWNENISKALTGKKLSEEHKKAISDSHKGCTPWNKGKIGVYTLSKEVREKISESEKGEKHWNWQGGKTSEAMAVRNSAEYKAWRLDVFERDNFTCQKCKIVGSYLEAHHIESFSINIENRMAVSNGITFCKKCHRNFHNIYGNKNDKNQLKEFLSK